MTNPNKVYDTTRNFNNFKSQLIQMFISQSIPLVKFGTNLEVGTKLEAGTKLEVRTKLKVGTKLKLISKLELSCKL